jgi:hypothetical protein
MQTGETMTPAQYARHKEWMHVRVMTTLSHLRNLWAVRDSYVVTDDIRADLIDLRERIQWLIDRPSAAPASTSSSSTNQTLGIAGNALQTEPRPVRTTSRAG